MVKTINLDLISSLTDTVKKIGSNATKTLLQDSAENPLQTVINLLATDVANEYKISKQLLFHSNTRKTKTVALSSFVLIATDNLGITYEEINKFTPLNYTKARYCQMVKFINTLDYRLPYNKEILDKNKKIEEKLLNNIDLYLLNPQLK